MVSSLFEYFRNRNNLINLLSLAIISLGIPLGVNLIRYQQTFQASAGIETIRFVGENVKFDNNQLVATSNQVSVELTSPFGPPLTNQPQTTVNDPCGRTQASCSQNGQEGTYWCSDDSCGEVAKLGCFNLSEGGLKNICQITNAGDPPTIVAPPNSNDKISTLYYRVALSPDKVSQAPTQPYLEHPMKVNIDFKALGETNLAGKKYLWVEFISSDNQVFRQSAFLELNPTSVSTQRDCTPKSATLSAGVKNDYNGDGLSNSLDFLCQ